MHDILHLRSPTLVLDLRKANVVLSCANGFRLLDLGTNGISLWYFRTVAMPWRVSHTVAIEL
jgi:hypothetical protein